MYLRVNTFLPHGCLHVYISMYVCRKGVCVLLCLQLRMRKIHSRCRVRTQLHKPYLLTHLLWPSQQLFLLRFQPKASEREGGGEVLALVSAAGAIHHKRLVTLDFGTTQQPYIGPLYELKSYNNNNNKNIDNKKNGLSAMLCIFSTQLHFVLFFFFPFPYKNFFSYLTTCFAAVCFIALRRSTYPFIVFVVVVVYFMP